MRILLQFTAFFYEKAVGCGADDPVKKKDGCFVTVIKVFFAVILLVVALVLIRAFNSDSEPPENPVDVSEQEANSQIEKQVEDAREIKRQIETMPTFTAADVAKAYDEDWSIAKQTFKDKRYKISGVVVDINTDTTDDTFIKDPYIILRGSANHFIRFSFKKNNLTKFSNIEEGVETTLNCVGESEVTKIPKTGICSPLSISEAYIPVNPTIAQIASDYNKNTAIADKKYKGETVIITGVITGIEIDPNGFIVLSIEGSDKNKFKQPKFRIEKTDEIGLDRHEAFWVMVGVLIEIPNVNFSLSQRKAMSRNDYKEKMTVWIDNLKIGIWTTLFCTGMGKVAGIPLFDHCLLM